MGAHYQPIAAMDRDAVRSLRAVLTDIDDTLTSAGRLPAVAYRALERLRENGVLVVPITGRPAGWCDLIARLWPVDGVVGENGGFYFHYDESARQMRRAFRDPAALRARNRDRLQAVARRALQAYPAAAMAADQPYRECDIAIDFCEDVSPPMPMADVQSLCEFLRGEGLTVKLSSIHVNAWLGEYDKLGMATRLMDEVFGLDLDGDRERAVYVGDSPNDAPMFGHFPLSVGVANVDAFRSYMDRHPAFRCERPGGEGFAELAEHLIAVRGGERP